MKGYWKWMKWNDVFPRMVWWCTHRATSDENRIECLLFHRLFPFLCHIAPEYNLVYNLCFLGIPSQFLANVRNQWWCTGNIKRRYHCFVCEHASRSNKRMNEMENYLIQISNNSHWIMHFHFVSIILVLFIKSISILSSDIWALRTTMKLQPKSNWLVGCQGELWLNKKKSFRVNIFIDSVWKSSTFENWSTRNVMAYIQYERDFDLNHKIVTQNLQQNSRYWQLFHRHDVHPYMKKCRKNIRIFCLHEITNFQF